MTTLAGHSYASALAHLVLTGSSCWALSKINSGVHGKYALSAYFLHLAHGVIGLFRYAIPQHKTNYRFLQLLRALYLRVRLLNSNLALPLITVQICLLSKPLWQSFILFLFVIPLLHILRYWLYKPYSVPEIEIFSQSLCLSTLGYVSYLDSNNYGYALLFSYIVAVFILRATDEFSRRDLFVYALSFFVFFSYRSLHYSLPFYYRYFY